MANDPGQRFRRIRQANQEVSRPSIVEPSLKEQVCYYTVRTQSRTSNRKVWFRQPTSLVRKFWET